MSADQHFQILLAAISLVFVVFSAGLGVLVRVVMKWQRTEDRLTDVAGDLKQLVADVAEDNRNMNERVLWLERHQWGGPPGPGTRARGRQ
jgi:hypothetical protein